jgi:hypothetical protein
MVFIYILNLAQNKFYVGKTDKPKFRLDSHFKNGGCAWTKKYKPIQILGLFPDCDDFDEDKYTLKYMSKYGIDNVRGGSFCQTTLSRENINTIERMISSSNDCCHFCGEKGHFIGRCSNKKEKQKYSKQNKHFLQLSKDYESADEVEWDDGSDVEEDNCIPWTRKGPFILGQNRYNESDLPGYSCGCSNGCGRNFDTRAKMEIHMKKYCELKKNVEVPTWSCSYCNKSFDTKKGAQFHENVHCKAKKQLEEGDESDDDEVSIENLGLAFSEMDKDDGIYELYGNIYLWCEGELYEESHTKTSKKLSKYFEMNSLFEYENYNWKSTHKKNNNKSTRKGDCHKCGRKGHYASKCYAKKHINGYYLN